MAIFTAASINFTASTAGYWAECESWQFFLQQELSETKTPPPTRLDFPDALGPQETDVTFLHVFGFFASEAARSISTQQTTHVIRYKHNTTENKFRTSLFSKCSVRHCYVSMRSGFSSQRMLWNVDESTPFPSVGVKPLRMTPSRSIQLDLSRNLTLFWVWWFQHLNCYDLLLPCVWFHFNQSQDRRVPFESFSARTFRNGVTQMVRCTYSLHFQMFVRDSFWDTQVSRLGLSLSSQASTVRERSCGRRVRLFL